MSVAPVKKKAKAPKPTPTQIAFREYERISFYLATQGDFDFKTDTIARKHFYSHIEAGADTAQDISYLSDQRSTGTKIPKGDHIDGLAIRTAELEKKTGKAKPVKQAAVKTPKKKPKLPLFKSGNPGLAAEVDAAFGSGDLA